MICQVLSTCGPGLGVALPVGMISCLDLHRRLKKANEKRLEQKKMQSQKKGDRRGKIDY